MNYIQLNKLTIKNRYLLSRINDLMDLLHGVMVISKIDLRPWYHQILVKVEMFRTSTNMGIMTM